MTVQNRTKKQTNKQTKIPTTQLVLYVVEVNYGKKALAKSVTTRKS